MTPEDISRAIDQLFGNLAQEVSPGSWQINQDKLRLLVLLSEDASWVILLVPIASVQEAQPFLEELLSANFETTQETRYAVHQDVVWGVYRHVMEGLNEDGFSVAIARLIDLQEKGLTPYFQDRVETQLRTIIQASKAQGQTLEATMQTLNRFYEEGLMGELSQNAQQREQILLVWKKQLQRLWPEIEP